MSKTSLSSSLRLSTASSYPASYLAINPIDENFLSSSMLDYYIPNNLQKDLNYPQVGGKDDIVWSLYSDEGTTEYSQNLDRFNITSRNLTHVQVQQESKINKTKQIKLILPKGMESVLSSNGGDTLKFDAILPSSEYNITTWRCLVRGNCFETSYRKFLLNQNSNFKIKL